MRQRHSRLHSIHFGIEGTQTYCPREVLDRPVRVAGPDSWEPAEKPSSRKIRIEYKRPVEQGDAAIKVADEMVEHCTASREGDRIFVAQLDGPASQPGTFSRLLRAIIHPAVELAPEVTPTPPSRKPTRSPDQALSPC